MTLAKTITIEYDPTRSLGFTNLEKFVQTKYGDLFKNVK